MKRLIALTVACGALTGCASLNYSPRFEALGKVTDTSSIEKRADEMKWAQASDVEAYLGQPPQGIQLENGKISADPSMYEVIGKVSTNYKDAAWTGIGWNFYDYSEDESWKKGYCYWQTPLNWVTFGLWGYLTPFHYPCKVMESNDTQGIAKRKQRIVDTLKKVTKSAGGNLVIITALGKLTTIEANTKVELSTLDMIGAEGWALKKKATAPASKPATAH